MAATLRSLLVLAAAGMGCSSPGERVYEGMEDGECVDGEDNDSDGAIDCADSDCERHLDCVDEDTDTWVPTDYETDDTGPTGDTDGWDCVEDAIGWMVVSGTLLLDEPSTGLAPVCSGEFLTAAGYQVQWLDVSMDLKSTYYLVDQPGRMVIDHEYGTLWAEERLTGALALINLDSAAVDEVTNLAGPVRDIAVASGGRAFVSVQGPSGAGFTSVALIGGVGAYVVEEYELGEHGEHIAYASATGKLFSGASDIASYTYNSGDDSVTQSQVVPGTCDSTPGNLSVTPDGAGVVLACSDGNNGAYGLYEYDTADLNVARGQFDVDSRIDLVAFDPAGTRLLVASGADLKVFDTTTRDLAAEHGPELTSCSNATVSDIAWSRGGKVAYALYTCGLDSTDGALAWWVVD